VHIAALPLLDEHDRPVRTNSIFLPMSVPGYACRTAQVTERELELLPADTTFGRARYTAVDFSLEAQASVVLMGTDHTSIHRPEWCLTSQGWTVTRKQRQTVPVASFGGEGLAVQRLDVSMTRGVAERKVQQGGVYVFWFVADQQHSISHLDRQWRMIRSLVQGRGLQRWAYISFFTSCAPGDEDAAFARLSKLIAVCVPQIEVPITAKDGGHPLSAAR
jgi:Protein of unknown function (DUF3485)